jgi:hypothetical protein
MGRGGVLDIPYCIHFKGGERCYAIVSVCDAVAWADATVETTTEKINRVANLNCFIM